MKEYTATVFLGMFLGLLLAYWFWNITQYITSFIAYTVSGAVVALVISAALFAWAWKSR
jgi:putative effector of murein hydrolase LrgA (UPF0299 family)